MDNNKIKEDVLQELIDLMDEKMLEGLKSKSPKFKKPEMAKVEIEAENPEDLEEGLEKAQDVVKELPNQEMESDEQKEDPEDLQRLMELYKKLK